MNNPKFWKKTFKDHSSWNISFLFQAALRDLGALDAQQPDGLTPSRAPAFPKFAAADWFKSFVKGWAGTWLPCHVILDWERFWYWAACLVCQDLMICHLSKHRTSTFLRPGPCLSICAAPWQKRTAFNVLKYFITRHAETLQYFFSVVCHFCSLHLCFSLGKMICQRSQNFCQAMSVRNPMMTTQDSGKLRFTQFSHQSCRCRIPQSALVGSQQGLGVNLHIGFWMPYTLCSIAIDRYRHPAGFEVTPEIRRLEPLGFRVLDIKEDFGKQ